MISIRPFLAFLTLFYALNAIKAAESPAEKASQEQIHFFESKVRPLLVEHCYECHSDEAGESSGDLKLDSAAAIAKGGLGGAALVPRDPDASLLIEVLHYDGEIQMPPAGKLSDEQIETMRLWVELGAPDPRVQTVDSMGQANKLPNPFDRDSSQHWAFQSPAKAGPPKRSIDSSRDVIDDFALAAAESAGVSINPNADDETMIRRLAFDLTGLPATVDQIEGYKRSGRADKYSRLVDQMLASPEFGERFGRHWLDVARYADTLGYATAGKERRYEGSERYRDWVINAFASDMPYNQMVMHQLAADHTDPDGSHGNLDAMGFLTLGRKFLNGHDTTDDQIDVITRGLLGMTVTCARCHDHKFDPIPTTDYYALFGVMKSSRQPKDGPSPLMMVDQDKPRDHHVFVRGQAGNRGEIAERQFLTSLRKKDEPRFTQGSGRRELAERITAKDNPLFARVMVNRVWVHLIGKPLVESPSDFGFRTVPPKVREALDDLAFNFSQHWSIKRLIRRIVMTRIYRQTAKVSESNLEADPENDFLARANRRRRDFESLRDSMLMVSGSVDQQIGGPPVEITMPTPVPRRTIYAMIDRQNLPPLFRTFDFADPNAHSAGRYFTTVPQQALYLLNSPQMTEFAKRTADRVRAGLVGDTTDDVLVDRLFMRVLGRLPKNEERAAAVSLVSQPAAALDPVVDPRFLWVNGIGKINQEQAVESFEPMKVFEGNRWQPAGKVPTDPPFGHAFLERENGHTPRDPSLAVVRRFTAPFDGEVLISGQVGHRSKEGDGVRVTIWVGGHKVWDENQKSSNRPFNSVSGRVKKGDAVDFVASCGSSDSFDSFFLRVNLSLRNKEKTSVETNSVRHFGGPQNALSTEPMDRLSQLAQVLLMSNEFAFID